MINWKPCMKVVYHWACSLSIESWWHSSVTMLPISSIKPSQMVVTAMLWIICLDVHTLGWSGWCSTPPAQKLPANHKKILSKSFLWQAWIIHDHGIPPKLHVNMDQMQVHYQMGGKHTWTNVGAKQVTTMGMDEKCTFMLVPSISVSGELLPWRAVFFGKMATGSCHQCSSIGLQIWAITIPHLLVYTSHHGPADWQNHCSWFQSKKAIAWTPRLAVCLVDDQLMVSTQFQGVQRVDEGAPPQHYHPLYTC